MDYEEFGIISKTPHKMSFEILVYVTFFLSILAILANITSLAVLLRFNKFKSNRKYNLIIHYLLLRLIQLISFFKSALIADSIQLIQSEPWLYKLEFFLNDFSDSSSNFILFTIWLILMSERNLIGLKWLYIDSNESHFYCIGYREAYLAVFYSINSVYSCVNTHFNGLNHFCGNAHNLASYSYAVHLIPFAFWVFTLSTLFWQFFGGYRDPILHNLTSTDHEYIKMIKIISILEFVEIASNKVHEMFVSFYGQELAEFCVKLIHLILIDKFVATLCSLVIMITFLINQNVFTSLVEIYPLRLFSNSSKQQNRNTNTNSDNSCNQAPIIYQGNCNGNFNYINV